ncbi:hypothetical protein [Mycetocola reblochoni]|uniref:hypothetical protein n=1 Tax=Mycetocola reblochoni TaxID=331618 RepID=UPI001180911D|nr:hypothetical protein [Mycetocola reblochoni]
MAVRRARLEFEDHYTQIPNAWLRDKRLSRRARGLLAEIMTHRVGWIVNTRSLMDSGVEGRDAIRKALQELAANGYLMQEKVTAEGGKFGGVDYVLQAPPTGDGKSVTGESTGDGFPGPGSPRPEKPSPENPHPKKNISKNNISKEQQGGDALSPTCGKHPHGTTEKCRACGDARRRWDAARAREAAAPKPATPIPPRSTVGMCEQHPFYPVPCDRCAEEAAA